MNPFCTLFMFSYLTTTGKAPVKETHTVEARKNWRKAWIKDREVGTEISAHDVVSGFPFGRGQYSFST